MGDSSGRLDPSNKGSAPGGLGWRDPNTERKQKVARASSTGYPISGDVRGFQTRTESRGPQHPQYIVWTFRVERFDSDGNQLPPVPVEMRSKSFQGFINEGDRVGISARW